MKSLLRKVFHLHKQAFQNIAPEIVSIIFMKADLRLVVDLQSCAKAAQNKAYEQTIKISNLQEMAKTIAYIQENGYNTLEDFSASYKNISSSFSEARSAVKELESQIKNINQQIHHPEED